MHLRLCKALFILLYINLQTYISPSVNITNLMTLLCHCILILFPPRLGLSQVSLCLSLAHFLSFVCCSFLLALLPSPPFFISPRFVPVDFFVHTSFCSSPPLWEIWRCLVRRFLVPGVSSDPLSWTTRPPPLCQPANTSSARLYFRRLG